MTEEEGSGQKAGNLTRHTGANMAAALAGSTGKQKPGKQKPGDQKPRRSAKERIMYLVLGLVAVGLVVGIKQPQSTPMAPSLPLAQRQPMPDFTFPTMDGLPWKLSRHQGHVVLLNFWATWCPPCQGETPSLVKIAGEYRARGLDIVGVSMDQGGLNNVRAFISAYHVQYPILLPRPFSPMIEVIQALPTTYLIDRQGRVANVSVGALDEESLRREVTRLLKEP